MFAKKIFAVILSLTLLFCAASPNVSAAGLSGNEKLMMERVNALANDAFESRPPVPDWVYKSGGYWDMTGLSIGVIKDGKTHFVNRGFHESDKDETSSRTPVTKDSVFEIGSQSKVFTGVMFSYLSEAVNPATGEPYVNLNDTVDKYYEIAPYKSQNGESICPTLLQLSTHTAGFDKNASNDGRPYGLDKLEQELQNMRYLNEPGAVVLYSNFGVSVLGQVLAKAYYGEDFPEKGYPELLDELLCEPLGLSSTAVYPSPDSEIGRRKTLPHNYDGSPSFFFDPFALAPAGGINSTATDMARFVSFIMGEYVPEGMEEMYAAALRVRAPLVQAEPYGLIYYGTTISVQPYRPLPYGVIVGNDSAYKNLFPELPDAGRRYGAVYYHGGLTNGYTGELFMCPETGTACVVLLNNMDESGAKSDVLIAHIMDYVLNGDVTNGSDKINLVKESAGQPGNRKVTGLAPGRYYTVICEEYKETRKNGEMLYVASDGRISADPKSIGPLDGTEAHDNLLNGNSYKVIDNGYFAP